MRTLPTLTLAAALAPAASLAYAAGPLNTPDATLSAQATPGTVNYLEGSATLAGTALSRSAPGQAALSPGQQVSTTVGKVELLLAPGIYLRVDEHSTVRMVTNVLTHVELTVERGNATIEVDRLFRQNNILVNQAGSQTRIEKPGLYEFTASPQSAYGNLGKSPDLSVRVLTGRASTRLASGQDATVKQGHVLDLAANSTHIARFDRDDFSDPIVDWTQLRADYLASTVSVQDEASGYASTPAGAGYGAGNLGSGYLGAGTYDPLATPFFSGFSGYPFFGAGWLGGGFYSPFYGFGSPFAFGAFGSPYGYGSGYPFGGGLYGGGYPFGGGFYGGGYPIGYLGGNGFYNRRPASGFNNGGPRPPLRPPINLHTPGSVRPGPAVRSPGGYQPSAPAPSFHPSAPAPSVHSGGMSGGGRH